MQGVWAGPWLSPRPPHVELVPTFPCLRHKLLFVLACAVLSRHSFPSLIIPFERSLPSWLGLQRGLVVLVLPWWVNGKG